GKTKDVYYKNEREVLLAFKDDVTGEDGVFDPGANTVGLSIDGAGMSALKMTTYFFERLKNINIPTHYIESDIKKATMTVKNAKMFGNGLEVICRFKAVGSFHRRYGAYCDEGKSLDAFTEVTLKDDERNDPPISEDALVQLGILTKVEYDTLIKWTKEVSTFVKTELEKKSLELYDIKLEFGYDKESKQMMLIDEISGGNMRVYQNGSYVEPLKLEQLFLNE